MEKWDSTGKKEKKNVMENIQSLEQTEHILCRLFAEHSFSFFSSSRQSIFNRNEGELRVCSQEKNDLN
jgi:hypothetical protein